MIYTLKAATNGYLIVSSHDNVVEYTVAATWGKLCEMLGEMEPPHETDYNRLHAEISSIVDVAGIGARMERGSYGSSQGRDD